MSLFENIDHIQIYVRDLNEAIEYYEKLGPMIRQTTHHGGSAEFMIANTVFEVCQVGWEGRTERNPGIDHISFLVKGGEKDLEQARKEIMGKGIKCTEVSLAKATGRYLFNFKDPAGYRLQANTEPDPSKVVKE